MNAYYNELDKLISNKFFAHKFSQKIQEYIYILRSGLKSGIKILGIDISFLEKFIPEENNEQPTRAVLQKYITSIRTKIVILIDEIDRLNKRQTLRIFNLINETSGFSNIVFVLFFDHEQVINTLSSPQKIKGFHGKETVYLSVLNERENWSKFLEKIIQKKDFPPFDI